jgi:hypothetical protein
MKSYPKIEYCTKQYGQKIWAFDKLDGSNFRAEWNNKSGWYKFGSRTQLISNNDPNFGDAIDIFLNKYGDDLTRIFKTKYSTVINVTIFGEYFGNNSFAGRHDINDKKDIVLFDVNLYKKGFVPPQDFTNNFGHLDIPKLIYKDEFNKDFVGMVKENKFNLKEGVICKGIEGKNIWMTKIKTNEWLEKVKLLYGEKAYLDEFK